MQVSELMSRGVVTLSPGDTVRTAASLLSRYGVGCLPVVNAQGDLRGMLTDRDIVLRCVASREDPDELRVRDVMSRKVTSIEPERELAEAAHLMAANQVRRLPVVKGRKVIGMLSLGDMAKQRRYEPIVCAALGSISANVRAAPSLQTDKTGFSANNNLRRCTDHDGKQT